MENLLFKLTKYINNLKLNKKFSLNIGIQILLFVIIITFGFININRIKNTFTEVKDNAIPDLICILEIKNSYSKLITELEHYILHSDIDSMNIYNEELKNFNKWFNEYKISDGDTVEEDIKKSFIIHLEKLNKIANKINIEYNKKKYLIRKFEKNKHAFNNIKDDTLKNISDINTQIKILNLSVKIVEMHTETLEFIAKSEDVQIIEMEIVEIKSSINKYLNDLNNNDLKMRFQKNINNLFDISKKIRNMSHTILDEIHYIGEIKKEINVIVEKTLIVQHSEVDGLSENVILSFYRTQNIIIILGIILIILSLFISYFLRKSIILSIEMLLKSIRNISNGNLKYRIRELQNDEIGELGRNLNAMAGNLQRLTVSHDDLSIEVVKRRNIEKKLRATLKKLEKQTLQLIQSQKLAGLGEIGAGIIHELAQPLNVMKITTQSILRDIEKNRFNAKTVKKDLPEINNQINRLNEIIEHMRIYTRSDDNLLMEKVNINDLIDSSLNFLNQQLKNHDIELIKNYSKKICKAVINPVQMEQVLVNLITNARHAIESDDKELKRIEIKTYITDHDNKIVIEISDTGIGIPKNIINKIYNPFFTTKDIKKGTGLGLSLTKKIIKQFKGEIKAESVLKKGTTFKIILPA